MLIDKLKEYSEKQNDKIALQVKRGNNWIKITYGDLWKQSKGVASTLKENGITAGDKVALFANNSPEWVIAYLGIHFSGAVVVPIDAQYGKEELFTLFKFSDAKGIIFDKQKNDIVNFLSAKGLKPLVFDLDSIVQKSPSNDFSPSELNPEDTMSIIFTSGTTGEPKGVQLSCKNIFSNIEGILKGIKITHKDNILNFLPLHHAYASTTGVFTPLYAGAAITFCESLKGPDILAIMQETGVTILPGVPQLFTLLERGIFQKIDSLGFIPKSFFNFLYKISRSVRNTFGIRLGKLFFGKIHKQFGPKFRFCVSGGAKLDKEVSERLQNLGILMLEGYGLTETSPVISLTPLSHPRPGSVGKPLEKIEIKIDNPNPEGQGEICMKGPNLMKGYYKNDKASSEVIKDSWFHTGDLGYIDKDGTIFITGRAKEVIVLPSGKNIYPDEVENHYQNTPMVKEICIMQTKDSSGDHKGLCAVVVPDSGELAARKVRDARDRIRTELGIVGASLPSYMKITDLVLLDETLPRTRLGKLKRSKIEEIVNEQRKSGEKKQIFEISPEIKKLMENPQAVKFSERLEDLLGREGPFYPGMDLEIDLGMDSLTRIQMDVILEQEFGVTIPEEESAHIRTLGDILERVVNADQDGINEKTALTWSERLAEPAVIPLDKMFNLKRGFLKNAIILSVKFIASLVLKILFGVELKGIEKIPKDKPVLICPNHQSYLDPVLMFAFLPNFLTNKLMFIAFQEYFQNAPFSWLVRAGRIILTGGASTLAESLKLSAEGLKNGMTVCIFPEGRRSISEDIMDPKPGAGILSCETNTPIVPVCIEGTYKVMSPSNPGFRRNKIRLIFGDPIEPVKDNDYQKMVEDWKETLSILKNK